MRRQRLRVIAVEPGVVALRPILATFCEGRGIVTALSDRRLKALRELVPAGSEIEIASFGEAVGKLATLAGGSPKPLAQKGLMEAAIARACLRLPADSPFAASAHYPGLHRKVMSVWDDLRSWGIQPDALLEAFVGDDGLLAEKVRSLVEVIDGAHETVASLGRVTNAERMRDCDPLSLPKGAHRQHIFIDAGSNFEPETADWILWAARAGFETVVVVEKGSVGLFEGAARLVKALGVEPEQIEPRSTLANALFTSAAGSGIAVEIAALPDPLAEAEWALRCCLEASTDGNWDRCAILAHDLEAYAPRLEAASKRLSIPIRVSRRVPLLQVGLAKFIVEIIEACASASPRALEKLLRHTYLGATKAFLDAWPDAVAEAEQAAEPWEAITAFAEQQREDHAWFEMLLDWRRSLAVGAHPLATYKHHIQDLGVMPWKWDEGVQTQQRDEHAQSALQRVLAQQASVARVHEDPKYSFRQFASLLRRLTENADTSLPAATEGVRIAASIEELPPSDVLLVLGMLEGSFPRRRTEDPVLHDSDRERIAERLKLDHALPNSRGKAMEERDEFVRVCAHPSERLIVSHPIVEGDRDNVPAFYLEELRRAGGESVTSYAISRRSPVPPLESCLSEADQRLAEALAAPKEPPPTTELEDPAAIAIVRGRVPRRYHVSELLDAQICGFRYWAQRRTKLPNEGKVSYRFHEIPMYANLMEMSDPESAVDALVSKLEESVREEDPAERSLQLAYGKRLLRRWVEQEFVARKRWPRAGVRVAVDNVEDTRLRQFLKVDGEEVEIQGRVAMIANESGTPTVHLYFAYSYVNDKGGDFADRLKDEDCYRMGSILWLMGKTPLNVEISAADRLTAVSFGEGRDVHDGRIMVGRQETKFLADKFRDGVRQGLATIRAGQPTPRPSESACANCGFGELCRSHALYGEMDPFAGGDQH